MASSNDDLIRQIVTAHFEAQAKIQAAERDIRKEQRRRVWKTVRDCSPLRIPPVLVPKGYTIHIVKEES